jgi:hypothetical protein
MNSGFSGFLIGMLRIAVTMFMMFSGQTLSLPFGVLQSLYLNAFESLSTLNPAIGLVSEFSVWNP